MVPHRATTDHGRVTAPAPPKTPMHAPSQSARTVGVRGSSATFICPCVVNVACDQAFNLFISFHLLLESLNSHILSLSGIRKPHILHIRRIGHLSTSNAAALRAPTYFLAARPHVHLPPPSRPQFMIIVPCPYPPCLAVCVPPRVFPPQWGLFPRNALLPACPRRSDIGSTEFRTWSSVHSPHRSLRVLSAASRRYIPERESPWACHACLGFYTVGSEDALRASPTRVSLHLRSPSTSALRRLPLPARPGRSSSAHAHPHSAYRLSAAHFPAGCLPPASAARMRLDSIRRATAQACTAMDVVSLTRVKFGFVQRSCGASASPFHLALPFNACAPAAGRRGLLAGFFPRQDVREHTLLRVRRSGIKRL
ncbi:hypothetical protein HYPSUDRAFT_200652 [Hypholoma sublateritium FD-334 SS-4]|uniref:Uncharacterized protein n=1 Tax=Hypholoma sublateritium (strain FD-334 SS-4) TaxID=945553 RepID=A0A0D2P6X1_HYPSF|nr:hypothetical protein HYPSUDRAFT_200652 [Hypholoma sublateritium FD-334 SS-4]